MSKSINIPLTDELKKFIASRVGDGSFYATPSEYVRDLIRREHERLEAAKIRESILEGFTDIRDGRFVEFSGDLKKDIKSIGL